MRQKRTHKKVTGLPGSHGRRKKDSKLNKPSVKTNTDVKVRSRYEKICVEYFVDENIRFVYEPLVLLDGRQYRPDFFLSDYNLFIEICGLNHLPHYSDRIEKKRKLYQKHNLNALLINYNGRGSLKKILQDELEKLEPQ